MTAHGWTDAQKRAYLIADNKLTENASWDYELLRQELEQLAAYGFDSTLTGYDADELAALLDARSFQPPKCRALETPRACPVPSAPGILA